MRVQNALVVIGARNARARVTQVARACKRAAIIGTRGVGSAVMSAQRALVIVCASNARSSETKVASTGE